MNTEDILIAITRLEEKVLSLTEEIVETKQEIKSLKDSIRKEYVGKDSFTGLSYKVEENSEFRNKIIYAVIGLTITAIFALIAKGGGGL